MLVNIFIPGIELDSRKGILTTLLHDCDVPLEVHLRNSRLLANTVGLGILSQSRSVGIMMDLERGRTTAGELTGGFAAITVNFGSVVALGVDLEAGAEGRGGSSNPGTESSGHGSREHVHGSGRSNLRDEVTDGSRSEGITGGSKAVASTIAVASAKAVTSTKAVASTKANTSTTTTNGVTNTIGSTGSNGGLGDGGSGGNHAMSRRSSRLRLSALIGVRHGVTVGLVGSRALVVVVVVVVVVVGGGGGGGGDGRVGVDSVVGVDHGNAEGHGSAVAVDVGIGRGVDSVRRGYNVSNYLDEASMPLLTIGTLGELDVLRGKLVQGGD